MNNKQADSEWQDIEHGLDELDLNAQVRGKFSCCLDQVDNTYDDRRPCRFAARRLLSGCDSRPDSRVR